MSVVYVLVPVALIIVSIALIAFIMSVKSGQFDDLDTPALRMLIDDEHDPDPEEQKPMEQSDSEEATS